MPSLRRIVEALAGFYLIYLISEIKLKFPGYQISEFLTVMRLILFKALVGLKHYQKRFHLVLLRCRDDPLDTVSRRPTIP